MFFCQKYSRVKRRNSYTITYRQHYGHILYFTLLKNRPAAVVKKVLTRPNDSFPSSFITPVQVTTELEVIDIDAILCKVIFISTSNVNSYVVKFPCALDID